MSNNNIVILSKKEFRDICKSQTQARITASTNLKDAKQDGGSVCINGNQYRTVNKNCFRRTKGYVSLGENEYARVVGLNPLAIILPLIILAIVLLILFTPVHDVVKPIRDVIGLEETSDISDDPATNFVSYVDVPGFKEEIELDEETPNLALRNPDGNTWNLYYAIAENGQSIYETKMITPGQQHNCNLKGILENGWHVVTITTFTATKEGISTGQPVATQTIRVHIS